MKFQKLIQVMMSMAVALLFGQLATAKQADLNPTKTQICYDAIRHASRAMGVPGDVMLAISLTETGKKIGGQVNPWPWTVNMEGKGVWFANQQDALAYVKGRYAQGARSFDMGCFQINYKWHHQHFRSIEEMFDPLINATYAAKYLRDLYLETGSWSRAAGYYHSRTPEYSNRYRKRFDRYLARLEGRDTNAPVFQGHGSETLRLSAADVPALAPRTYAPLLEIGRREPLISPQGSTSGSLVSTSSASGGLLRKPKRTLF